MCLVLTIYFCGLKNCINKSLGHIKMNLFTCMSANECLWPDSDSNLKSFLRMTKDLTDNSDNTFLTHYTEHFIFIK